LVERGEASGGVLDLGSNDKEEGLELRHRSREVDG
jgi:hypothetical protein